MKSQHEQYAYALYEACAEEGLEDAVLSQMKEIAEVLKQNSDYSKLLDSPMSPLDTRLSLADSAFSGVHEYLINFIKLLIEAKIFKDFDKCFDVFSAIYDEKHAILRAKAISALPLDSAQLDTVRKNLEKKTGKNVILINVIDSSLIGGMVLDYGDEQIDKSVRTTLKTIGNLISASDI